MIILRNADVYSGGPLIKGRQAGCRPILQADDQQPS